MTRPGSPLTPPTSPSEGDDRFTTFRVPVFFLLGRHDWQVPSTLAERYFERIDAPVKKLVWFEHSAHNPPFEEPALFTQTLVDLLAPVTAHD